MRCSDRIIKDKQNRNISGFKKEASLTVEASLVLPLFMFFLIAFIYFIQIFITQEILQKAITDTGLGMARAAYIYSDFHDAKEAEEFDSSILDEEVVSELKDMINTAINSGLIKYAVKTRLDTDKIDHSCIVGGFDGIRFDDSKLMQGNNDIDIVARYKIRIPVRLFGLFEKEVIQRVRLRGWNGQELTPLYLASEENTGDDKNDEAIVYVAETGTVYHLNRNCSHIKLSVRAIEGIPTWQRNNTGEKYYPCESCLKHDHPETGTYYITSYGDRYHQIKDCSRLKRTIYEVPLSEVSHMRPCKRCGGG